jgi:hypothetical protein
MGPSRREFLHDSLAAFSTFALFPLSCNHAKEPNTTYASMHPEKVSKLEPSYLDLEREGKLEQIEKELWEIFQECHGALGDNPRVPLLSPGMPGRPSGR